MGVKYNPNVTPVFQMPGTTNTNEPLPPVNNGNNMNNGNDINHALYDNILAQNEALKQQNLDIASWNAQWQSLMDQENAARQAAIDAQAKEQEEADKRFRANLALGMVKSMGSDNKSDNLMTTIVNPIINRAISSKLNDNFYDNLDNNVAAYGGRQYNRFDLGGPETRYTADGRKLTYSTVPNTGEVRWVDLGDSKDFNGVTGYRFYDDAGNKMHYTPWQEAANTQEPLPTVEEVDDYIKARGYNPDFIRHMPQVDWMNRSSGAVKPVYPEFYLLSAGRGGMNGAVDSLGEVGNTVLTNPWVDAGLTSYFGAHGLNHTINEGIDGWGDAALTALEVMPAMRVGKAIYDTSKPFVTALYDNGTLWDRYTTFRGRFGNYGDNLATNIYGTLARRYGLPDKARIPADAMRKIGEPVNIENGMVNITGSRPFNGNPHTNFSLDRPVVSHHKFVGDGADTNLVPTKDVLEQASEGSLKSIEPSDMFINGSEISITPSRTTLISGDTETLQWARKNGMQTLSSPRLRRLYNQRIDEYKQELARIAALPPHEQIMVKSPVHPKDIRTDKGQRYWPEYAEEVQRLQSRMGTPTMDDFNLLEEQTGLNAGVAPISYYYDALEQMNTLPVDADGVVLPLVYPNGRAVEISSPSKRQIQEHLLRSRYNHLFYDPASMVEFNWKNSISGE